MKYTKLIVISGQLNSVDGNVSKQYIYKSLKEACKTLNIEHILFDAFSLKYEKTDDGIYHISDNNNSYEISVNDCPSSIVYSRYVNESKIAQDLINSFEADKCLIINPFSKIHISSNKYLLAELLNKENIPQARYQLLSASDIDEDDVKKKAFNKKLDAIYPDVVDEEKKDKLEYIVKALDGYDSKGIFLCTRKNILSIMQAIFKINEDLNRKLPSTSKKTPLKKFLLQEKMNSNSGDIKVHVITMGDNQKIIFAHQASKNKNDFRSNVSENSESLKEKKLSPEQEELVYKTAKASGLIWATVDLMETDKGPKVIEYNSTPGDMYWISKAMNDQNIFELVLKFIEEN